jgi:ethanolamine ammonia-lyase small subunit
MLDEIRSKLDIPTQGCVLSHVTTTLELIRKGSPVDLVFQSIAGTEAANKSFGIDLSLLTEARDAALSLRRGTVGDNVMYFETGQGSALSANAHHGVDQQTLEARAYAVARHFKPLLVNTVVGFIGPEYLFDGKQITRAGLEDHFCGKLMGVPMGVDVCYTNHAEADQDDMDALLALLVAAGVNFVMGVPGADDVMLGYQSTSFHDALAMRDLYGRRPAPEFEAWLSRQGLMDAAERIRPHGMPGRFRALLAHDPEMSEPVFGQDCAQTKMAQVMTNRRTPQREPDDEGLWTALRGLTAARIGLARAGASLATAPLLDFKLAHARARDAVHEPLDQARLGAELSGLGVPVLAVASAVEDRQRYLMRPDLGRRLAPDAETVLAPHAGGHDVVFVVADGLSARAVQRHAQPVLAGLVPALRADGWHIAPLVVVRHGRVAIGDAIAASLGASCVAVLIGERPGLSAPDSMGAYLTWQPGPLTTDAERNCISNIRPEGIGYADAAFRIAHMLRAMRARGVSGVRLKDDSDRLPIGATIESNEPDAGSAA